MPIRPPYAAVLAASLLAAAPAAAGGGFNTTTHGEVRDCSDIEVTASGRRVALAEDSLSVPVPAAGRRLRVETSRNGGVHVVGGAARDFEVRVCKAAVAAGFESAEQAVERVTAGARDGRLTVQGPGGDDWLAFLLIAAPAGAAMDIEVENGPLSVRGLDGDLLLRATNGPISLRETGGEVAVEVRNGPVSIADGGGRITVDARNGPISVDLAGDGWVGEGLEARAVNGPLSVSVAEGYGSGVVVEASEHSPWSCSGCAAARRSWDDDGRRLELGEGPVRVRLATHNGPVSIRIR
jgi:hypothetical protein